MTEPYRMLSIKQPVETAKDRFTKKSTVAQRKRGNRGGSTTRRVMKFLERLYAKTNPTL